MSESNDMTLEGEMTSLPATILSLLDVPIPENIPKPIDSIVNIFKPLGVERIVLNILDNFGLFEITYYKPEFLISQSTAFLLLATQNPYTLGMFHQLFFAGYDHKAGFHLLKYLNEHQKQTIFIGRQKDIERYHWGTPAVAKSKDMNTWIEAAKVINKYSLSILHYLDFEELYQTQSRQHRNTPEELIKKLIKRSDKWFLANYRQLRSKSLMIVLGNHGRYKIDIDYQGKVAQWRSASVPLAIFIYKE